MSLHNTSNINEKIFNLYNSGGYWTKYASDVWITIILILIVFYTFMYFNILNNFLYFRIIYLCLVNFV